MENWVFEYAANFLRHYRSAVGRIPPEDLRTAGGLRIADLDQACPACPENFNATIVSKT